MSKNKKKSLKTAEVFQKLLFKVLGIANGGRHDHHIV